MTASWDERIEPYWANADDTPSDARRASSGRGGPRRWSPQMRRAEALGALFAPETPSSL